MTAVQHVAYSTGCEAIRFMLYRHTTDDGHRSWVYWHRGISTHEIRNRLCEVRMVIDWNGVDHTYDFQSGQYRRLQDHPEEGWIQPRKAFDHSGGVVVSFGPEENPQSLGGYGEQVFVEQGRLHDLNLDSESSLRLEVRSRLSASTGWHSRVFPLCVKRATKAIQSSHSTFGQAVCAA